MSNCKCRQCDGKGHVMLLEKGTCDRCEGGYRTGNTIFRRCRKCNKGVLPSGKPCACRGHKVMVSLPATVCPKCRRDEGIIQRSGTGFQMKCRRCGETSPIVNDESQAYAAWADSYCISCRGTGSKMYKRGLRPCPRCTPLGVQALKEDLDTAMESGSIMLSGPAKPVKSEKKPGKTKVAGKKVVNSLEDIDALFSN